jgi:hypothetical protein
MEDDDNDFVDPDVTVPDVPDPGARGDNNNQNQPGKLEFTNSLFKKCVRFDSLAKPINLRFDSLTQTINLNKSEANKNSPLDAEK